jgi:cAMP-dependent protein kinase regulator
MDPRLRDMSPEEYLADKNVRGLLIRIVRSLLCIRPANVERHVVNLLLGSSAAPSRAASAGLPGLPGPRPVPLPSRPESTDAGPALAPPRGASPRVRSLPVAIRAQPPADGTTLAILEAATRTVDLFSFLQDDQRRVLVAAMSKREYARGDVVLRAGAPPSDFFIIERGDFVVQSPGESTRLSRGQYFGEQALISGAPQNRSVVCDSDSALCWAIDQRTYLALLRQHHWEKRQKFVEVLSRVPVLRPLQPAQIALVADALRSVDAPEGKVIVRQGDMADEFYIVLEGECVVKKAGDGGGEVVVRRLGPGDYFGELALLRNEPRAATIVASKECKLVELAGRNFKRLLGPCQELFEAGMRQYE